MLLIFSEETDRTTDYVCSWLNYLKTSYVRINNKINANIIDEIEISNNTININLSRKQNKYKFEDIDIVWFRRGYLTFSVENLKELNISENAREEINRHIIEQNTTLGIFFYENTKYKKTINDPRIYNANKLITLQTAIDIGLKVPATIITKNKNSILNFKRKYKNIITKHIQDIINMILEDGKNIFVLTNKVYKKEITEETYYYSLFQEEIKKKYELRIFYFLGKFYSAAIFSQLSEVSKIDFRDNNLNREKPSRIAPFNLPKEIKIKLDNLMKKSSLESGSIDMIVTPENEYVFLEVNPVGQLDFVSKPCNYYIEKDIAKYFRDGKI
ncbi:MAG: grasp-with-spasm system ATP-grasp peptide maturase [Bacteroidales bacterium]|nr:grasp-with-spasm system ATP-grasp peptide maturase [Bacteroidales bacterium]